MTVTPTEYANEPLVIGIAGGSGSGKTTFAELLCNRLAPDAVVLSHDDYYKNLPDMTDAEAAVYNFDSPDALDTFLLVEHLHALKRGLPAKTPLYDFAAHARIDEARLIEPKPFILVEGLLIMCDSELLDLFDLVIFLDTDPDVRILRRIERDCRTRGADLARAAKMYLDTTKPAQEAYVDPFKKKADIIVSDITNERSLDIVALGIRGMLERRTHETA